jgi:phenylalanyl-tRNA synthetase beta chain
MAERGVRLGLKMMQQLAGGTIAQGLIDAYPLPPKDPTVEISSRDAERWLGIRIEAEEMAAILARLQFKVEVEGEIVRAAVPDHRLDIGEGVVGKADLMEEIARIYGYDRIPETQISDRIPPQYRTPRLEQEEALRDLLVGLGLQEVITYRLTSPTREMRLLPPDLHLQEGTYVHLDNPISSERVVMRKRLLASVMEIVESNARLYDRIAVFEIGPIFLPQKEDDLPAERKQLAIVLTGPRVLETWQGSSQEMMDFYDMKGMVEKLLSGLKLGKGRFVPGEHPSFHPGKCARLQLGEKEVGILGEIHPLVQAQYEHAEAPIIAAEFDLSQLLEGIPDRFTIGVVSAFPPVLEDLALVVNEEVSAQRVQEVIQEAGGDILVEVHLFDLYRGEQIGEGKKSLAYALTYQAPDRTLTDQEVAKVRENILREVEAKLAAKLRE